MVQRRHRAGRTEPERTAVRQLPGIARSRAGCRCHAAAAQTPAGAAARCSRSGSGRCWAPPASTWSTKSPRRTRRRCCSLFTSYCGSAWRSACTSTSRWPKRCFRSCGDQRCSAGQSRASASDDHRPAAAHIALDELIARQLLAFFHPLVVGRRLPQLLQVADYRFQLAQQLLMAQRGQINRVALQIVQRGHAGLRIEAAADHRVQHRFGGAAAQAVLRHPLAPAVVQRPTDVVHRPWPRGRRTQLDAHGRSMACGMRAVSQTGCLCLPAAPVLVQAFSASKTSTCLAPRSQRCSKAWPAWSMCGTAHRRCPRAAAPIRLHSSPSLWRRRRQLPLRWYRPQRSCGCRPIKIGLPVTQRAQGRRQVDCGDAPVDEQLSLAERHASALRRPARPARRAGWRG